MNMEKIVHFSLYVIHLSWLSSIGPVGVNSQPNLVVSDRPHKAQCYLSESHSSPLFSLSESPPNPHPPGHISIIYHMNNYYGERLYGDVIVTALVTSLLLRF